MRDGLPLLVEGNRIKAVAPGDAAAPEGAQAIDCGGRVIMPGLIDAHWYSLFAALPLSSLMTGDVGYIHLAAAATMNAAHHTKPRGRMAGSLPPMWPVSATWTRRTCSSPARAPTAMRASVALAARLVSSRSASSMPGRNRWRAAGACHQSLRLFPCPPRDRGQCGSQSQFLGLLQVAAR